MSYSRPTPAAAAGLTPTFITSKKGDCMCAHMHKVDTNCFRLCRERSKCVGIMFVLHQAVAGSLIYHDWNLLLPCDPHIRILPARLSWCFCPASGEHYPAVDR